MSHTVKLLSKKMITNDVCELHFEKPQDYGFVPGQFVQFIVPQTEKPIFRSYSISSSPNSDHLEFCIKLIPNGRASSFFTGIQPGDYAEISDPRGIFNAADAPINYFIATGVGLAPIISMLESMSRTNKAELLFGARFETDLFWLKRLDDLMAKNTNFNYKITLSKPDKNWKGLAGRVTDHIVIDPDAHYFICGRVEMVKDIRATLLNNGLNTKSVHFEIF